MKQEQAADVIRQAFGDGGDTVGGNMVVGDAEIAYLLMELASLAVGAECELPECAACDMFRTVWWGWCNDLTHPVRVKLQRKMRDLMIPLPPSPVEVWNKDAVPTAR